jgi:hypothetical protein
MIGFEPDNLPMIEGQVLNKTAALEGEERAGVQRAAPAGAWKNCYPVPTSE